MGNVDVTDMPANIHGLAEHYGVHVDKDGGMSASGRNRDPIDFGFTMRRPAVVCALRPALSLARPPLPPLILRPLRHLAPAPAGESS